MDLRTMIATSAAQAACQHCGLPTAPGTTFCCLGCERVHGLLVARGLGHYYELRDQLTFGKPRPIEKTPAAEDYIELNGRSQARFYLEGIHCLGCLWLLEKLPEFESRIASAHLDFANQILTINLRSRQITWSEVVNLLAELGYLARPLTNASSAETERERDWHQQLMRIGVAAFCAGNIMLLAVSIYGGTDSRWSSLFGWLSFALAIPVLTYSAWPLYRSAFLPLRQRRLSVDFAIVLALIAGTAASLNSLLQGSASVYFDSLSMLVFLLLSSRALLQSFREGIARKAPCLNFLSSERYDRGRNSPQRVSAEELKAGDLLVLHQGQTLPTDSRLQSEESHFDLSLLTGESSPVKFLHGERIEAGARLISENSCLEVALPASESRLASILAQIRQHQLTRTPALDFADRIGQHFAWVVLLLAALTLYFFPGHEGFERALALVIVTCPCVLAFAVPLTLTLSLQRAASRGILFRSPDKLEALAGAKTFFFDKTGTLTTGRFTLLQWNQVEGDEASSLKAAASLEAFSQHPVALAIVRHAAEKRISPAKETVTAFQEQTGFGVKGKIANEEWAVSRLGNSERTTTNTLGVYRNNTLVAALELGDALRAEAPATIAALTRMGIQTTVLSGDREAAVEKTAKAVGASDWRSLLCPEEKAAIVAKNPGSVMVGDGANDSIAFQGAGVGVAVQGAMELSLQNCDLVLTQPGIGGLLDALRIAKRAMVLLRTNFALTLSYNLLAGTLAIAGLMQPLFAALLMPLSALSVFAFTTWQTKRML